MNTTTLFEEFGTQSVESFQEIDAQSEAVEQEKLEAYERGYKAGWDDSLAAQDRNKMLLADTVKQSLEDAAFTREEALQAFLQTSRPLLEAMTQKVLPSAAKSALPNCISDQLTAALEQVEKTDIRVNVAPDQFQAVKSALSDMLPERVTIRPNPALKPGQACLGMESDETFIDLETLVHDMCTAVDEFLNQSEETA